MTLLSALLVGAVVLLCSWGVLVLLASRLPPGVLRELAAFLPNCVRMVRRLRKNPEVPRRAKVAVVFAGLWVLSPIDLIPEFLPVIGPLDDVVVVALALRYAASGTRTVLLEAWDGDPDLLERLLGSTRVVKSTTWGSTRRRSDRSLVKLDGRGALSSGAPVTDDLGFGPAAFLSPDEVQSMAAVLSGVSDERLAGAFAALEMGDVYPMVWDRPDEVDDNSSGTLVATRAAIALVERAAVRREGMLFVVL